MMNLKNDKDCQCKITMHLIKIINLIRITDVITKIIKNYECDWNLWCDYNHEYL